MRKKKVIEILKTFQEQEDPDARGNGEKKNSFGEQFERIDDKKKSFFNAPLPIEALSKNNNTYYMGKPRVIQQQNRVKKLRRRDNQQEPVKTQQ